jgi:hypothetical protein
MDKEEPGVRAISGIIAPLLPTIPVHVPQEYDRKTAIRIEPKCSQNVYKWGERRMIIDRANNLDRDFSTICHCDGCWKAPLAKCNKTDEDEEEEEEEDKEEVDNAFGQKVQIQFYRKDDYSITICPRSFLFFSLFLFFSFFGVIYFFTLLFSLFLFFSIKSNELSISFSLLLLSLSLSSASQGIHGRHC